MKHIPWNNDWFFSPDGEKEMVAVRIPHTNCELPLHYFDDSLYQLVSHYKKTFEVEQAWVGSHVWIQFDGVGHAATVYLNDREVGTHLGGYTAFAFDLTSYLDRKRVV